MVDRLFSVSVRMADSVKRVASVVELTKKDAKAVHFVLEF